MEKSLRLEQIAFKFNRHLALDYQQKVWQQKKAHNEMWWCLVVSFFMSIIPVHERRRLTITWSYLLPTQSCAVQREIETIFMSFKDPSKVIKE